MNELCETWLSNKPYFETSDYIAIANLIVTIVIAIIFGIIINRKIEKRSNSFVTLKSDINELIELIKQLVNGDDLSTLFEADGYSKLRSADPKIVTLKLTDMGNILYLVIAQLIANKIIKEEKGESLKAEYIKLKKHITDDIKTGNKDNIQKSALLLAAKLRKIKYEIS